MNERADHQEGATAVSTLGGQVLALLQSVHWW
jgi:hypothetical protein